MKFCKLCDNMLYIKLNTDKQLVFYCKHCGDETIENKKNGSILIIDDNKTNDEIKYSQYINKNIKHDPCLPRVNNIICPNINCSKKEHEDNEVIYIKYDPINMKYLYHCCYCEHFWTKAK